MASVSVLSVVRVQNENVGSGLRVCCLFSRSRVFHCTMCAPLGHYLVFYFTAYINTTILKPNITRHGRDTRPRVEYHNSIHSCHNKLA